MNPTLDIIPIHVIADSANKAEMLNGTLRARGLAVKPQWLADTEDWQGSPAELVYYFADTGTPTLEQAVAHASREDTMLIVIAQQNDPQATARALAAGAADRVRLEDGALLVEISLRERRRRQRIERWRELERSGEHARRLLETRFRGSHDPIAMLSDGIITEVNAACAACFGFADPEALTGLPFMDLFTPASQSRLKHDIRALLRDRQSRVVENLELRGHDGSERKVDVTLDAAPGGDEQGILVRIAGATSANDESAQYLQALESENQRLKSELAGARQTEAGTRLLLPGVFAPIATEQIGLPRADSLRALVFIRPADPQAVFASFGLLGRAEIGIDIAAIAAPLFEDHDFATRIGDTDILALVTRPDEAEVERWTNSLLHSLGQGIFEGGGRSTHLDFVAGYAPVNRVRRLDVLIRQAREAADGASPGTVSRGNDGTATVAIDDDSWETLIREALESQRYTAALLPIEDLASGTRFWAALPRLLDSSGHEIAAELFQPPACRLGLLPILERRLVGHALRALIAKSGDGAATRIIVPMHATTLVDAHFFDFLEDLFGHAGRPLPPKSLVLELDIGQIYNRIRETEHFAERALARDCAFGLRGYTPGTVNKSAEMLPIEILRMVPTVTERLADEDDETTAATVRAAAARLKERGIRLIAGGVADTNTMAKLYNLGIGTVEGPAIGEPELFRADRAG